MADPRLTRYRLLLVVLAALALAEAVPAMRWLRWRLEGEPPPRERSSPALASSPRRSTVRFPDFLCAGAQRGSLSGEELGQEYALQLRRITAGSRLITRESNGLQFWSTPRGDVWIPQDERETLSMILAEQGIGLYDAEQARIRHGDVVLDVGAHVGLFAREALARGAARVIAMEPVPATLECLRRNLREEIAAGRVTVYEKGAWNRDDVLPMHVAPENSGTASFVVLKGARGDSVAGGIGLPLTTIDTMVAELHLTRVDFIKMDIEGAETLALEGARMTLVQHRPRIAACVYHQPSDRDQVPAVVRKAVPGYRVDYRCLDTGRGASAHLAFLSPPR